MNNPLISLCMIVKNEEDVIARCLQSVRGIVDELIVVDTGSTDRTIEIAESEEAAVYSREWRNDFAFARNESIELAKGAWILVLDADEVLAEGQDVALRELLAAHPNADGFFLRIHNFFGVESRQTGSSISASLRLFRNKPRYRYNSRIHEQIVQPILTANPSAQLLYTDIRINHGGYLPEVVHKKNKVQRNMDLLLRELEHTDNEGFHRYNLGIEYMRTNEHEKAIEQFHLSRTLTDYRITSFGHIAILREINCMQILGRWEEAAKLCEEAATSLGNFPDLYLVLGRIHYQLQQWHEADKAFRKAIEIGEAPPQYTSVSGSGTYSAYFHLGKTREQLHDYEGAIDCYTHALKSNSGLLSPFLRLISLLSRLHEPTRITSIITQLFHLESARTWWSIAISYYQLGLYEQAAELILSQTMPPEKKLECRLLLIRSQLLAGKQSEEKSAHVQRRTGQTAKALFYAALSRNDDASASYYLQYLKKSHNRRPSPKASDTLSIHLYSYLLMETSTSDIPLHLPQEAYASLWGELYFLYILAAKEHLFGLQSQITAYWNDLLTRLPDPLLRLKGRYELIKTVHVRIYHIFQHDNDSSIYAPLWNEVKPKLLTLIDDLLMEELN